MSSSDPIDLVLAERRESALVLTLNRPNVGNPIGREVAEALATRIEAARHDTMLRAIVLTGAGDRYFCTGGDVKAYARLEAPADLDRVFNLMRDVCDAVEALPVPVIAAINGYAVGGGAELALACDLRIAAEGVQIGFPQSRLGILPGWDGTERLVRAVGRANAARLLFSGKRVDATRALALGLIDEVAPAGKSVDQALALAATFAEVAPLSLGAIKEALRDAMGTDRAGARQRGREAFARLWFTDDHKEAERAFIEKRAPRFTGA